MNIFEAQPNRPPHDAIIAGLDVLSASQQVLFQPYLYTVLPIDGYVFWVNAQIANPDQVQAAGLALPTPIAVTGTLHYSSDLQQTPESNYSVTQVVFNTDTPVSEFASISPKVLYVASFEGVNGNPIRVAFSRHDQFYEEAGIWHYFGHAVYSTLATQLIDDESGFNQRQVVSNSLPALLSMLTIPPIGSDILMDQPIPLYPSFLAPFNLEPPYGVVDIPDGATEALQPTPYVDIHGNHWQLCSDNVKITLFGLRNEEAQDFLDQLLQYSLITGNFGIMEGPVLSDKKRPQVELQALAMQKELTVKVSYYQTRMRDLARQVIETCIVPPPKLPPGPIMGPGPFFN